MHQGAKLVAYIRSFEARTGRRPTYGDLLRSGISTCPWKRLKEPAALAALKKGEHVKRGKDRLGRIVFMVA